MGGQGRVEEGRVGEGRVEKGRGGNGIVRVDRSEYRRESRPVW